MGYAVRNVNRKGMPMAGGSGGGDRRASVQAVGVAAALLDALAAAGGPMTLGALAEAVGLAPAKAHRYAASLVAAGLVARRASGSYDLGPAAARVGLAALARHDPVNRAADALPALVERTGRTAMLSVWGDRGPTVVRYEPAAVPLVTTLGLGSILAPERSATGHVFLAWLPERVAAAAAPGADLAALRARVRKAGAATADGGFIPGLAALAAPVLDAAGDLAAVATLLSADPALLSDVRARAALLAAAG